MFSNTKSLSVNRANAKHMLSLAKRIQHEKLENIAERLIGWDQVGL